MYKFAILAITILFGSCCSIKSDKLHDNPSQSLRIEFGNGGGFAGALNQYSILDNGELHAVSGTKSKSFVRDTEVCARKSKKLFKKASKIDFAGLNFQHPGNMYYFIKYFDGDKAKVITWGDANFPVDKDIQNIYNDLMALLDHDNHEDHKEEK